MEVACLHEAACLEEGPCNAVEVLEVDPEEVAPTFIATLTFCFLYILINKLRLLTFMLLLELDQELRVVFNFIIDMLLSPAMLFSAKRRRVLQVDSAVLAIKVRHYYLYYNSNNN